MNDAPALAQADVGIAVGSGTDVAAETPDIILVNSDPKDVVQMIQFGRATYRKMIQNLAWAVGYNVVAIPLAAGVLYPHFMLSPAMGAVLMSLSTVVVAINAQLLKKVMMPKMVGVRVSWGLLTKRMKTCVKDLNGLSGRFVRLKQPGNSCRMDTEQPGCVCGSEALFYKFEYFFFLKLL